MNGVPLKVVDDGLLPIKRYQYRKPVSKKKRVRKKFVRNPQNFKTCHQAILDHGVLFITRDIYKQILRQQKTTIAPVMAPRMININLKVG